MVGAAVTSFTVVVGAVVLSFTVVGAIVISFTVVGAIVGEITIEIVVPVVGAVVITFTVVGAVVIPIFVVVIVSPFWIVWFVVFAVLLLGDNPIPAPVPTPAMANRANRAPPIAFFLFLGFLTRIKIVTIWK